MRYPLTKTFIKPFLPKLTFSEKEWVFVMHIPKTAGTTFRFTLYNHVDDAVIYPNYQELTQKLGGKYLPGQKLVELGIPDQIPSTYRILIGHYPFDFLRFFTTKPKTITFLRNPLQRTISHLIHIQKLNPNYKDYTLDKIFETTKNRMSNFQARILGYQSKKDNESEVMENFEKIDFIGISEQFDDSIKLLNHEFGWPLKPVKAMNKTRKTQLEILPELEDKIREILNLDFMLYEKTLKIFNAKKRAAL